MDTTREDRSLESSPNPPAPAKDEGVEESERLSTLFRKYSIEQYFWRNYNNRDRIKSLLWIFGVTAAAVVVGVIVLRIIFPV